MKTTQRAKQNWQQTGICSYIYSNKIVLFFSPGQVDYYLIMFPCISVAFSKELLKTLYDLHK